MIRLPYKFEPRWYQIPLLQAIDSGYKRAIVVWHRRSGKDLTLINLVAKKMAEKIGTYFYFFPSYAQARKVIWDGRDKDGLAFLDHFPKELLDGKPNDSEMKLKYKNGSLFQLVGTDNVDSVVGTNPIGCVFSEYSLQDPKAWDYIRPILAENGGWAVFNYTPRGENHGYALYEMAKKDKKNWFVQLLTVDDTKIIPNEVLEQERREIIEKDGTDALYQQEYKCSFKVPIAGAYYAQQILKATDEGRIGNVPYEPTLPVDTWWDLGIDDSTSIWFSQSLGKEIRLIDYFEVNGEGLVSCIKSLQEKEYVYGEHHAPHDIQVRELTSGKTRHETAKSLGVDFRIVPKLSLEDGIEATRNIFNRCWFDEDKCRNGLNALKSYHKEYDDKNKTYRNHPFHDWSSHGCLSADSLILTDHGDIQIKDIKIGDMVWTPNGFSKVLKAGPTKKTDNLIKLNFNKGNSIVCTPEHKFFTDRGVVDADTLSYNDIIWDQYCHEKLSSTDMFLDYRESIIERTVGRNLDRQIYIGQFGKKQMDQYQKDMTFTTKIEILLIMKYQILRLLKYMTTYLYTLKKVSGLAVKIIKNNLLKLKNLLRYGINQKKGESGIRSMVLKFGILGNGLLNSVRSVEENIKHLIQQDQNTVTRIVNKRHLEGAGVNQLVYDLTVEKNHCYLANGVLVSNSDGFRYLSVGYEDKFEADKTVLPDDSKLFGTGGFY